MADRFSDQIGEFAGIHRVDVENDIQTPVSLQPEYDSLRRVGVQSDGDIIVSDSLSCGMPTHVATLVAKGTALSCYAPNPAQGRHTGSPYSGPTWAIQGVLGR